MLLRNYMLQNNRTIADIENNHIEKFHVRLLERENFHVQEKT